MPPGGGLGVQGISLPAGVRAPPPAPTSPSGLGGLCVQCATPCPQTSAAGGDGGVVRCGDRCHGYLRPHSGRGDLSHWQGSDELSGWGARVEVSNAQPPESLPVSPELGSVPRVLPARPAARYVPVSDLPDPRVVSVAAGSWEPTCQGSGWVGEFTVECLPPRGARVLQLGLHTPGAHHPHRIPGLSSERCLREGSRASRPQVKDSTARNHITGWKGEVTSPWEQGTRGQPSRVLTLSPRGKRVWILAGDSAGTGPGGRSPPQPRSGHRHRHSCGGRWCALLAPGPCTSCRLQERR